MLSRLDRVRARKGWIAFATAGALSLAVAQSAAEADVITPHAVQPTPIVPHPTPPAVQPAADPTPAPSTSGPAPSPPNPAPTSPGPNTGAPPEPSAGQAPAPAAGGGSFPMGPPYLSQPPTDSPNGPWDPACDGACRDAWLAYFEASAAYAEAVSNDVAYKTLQALATDTANLIQTENEVAANATRNERENRERAQALENVEPDAISGADLQAVLDDALQPVYTEVTDDLISGMVDGINCEIMTWVVSNRLLDRTGSNCF